MTKNIHIILFPLLVASYASGSKLTTIDMTDKSSWFGFLYFVLFWSFYFFLVIYKVVPFIHNYTFAYFFFLGLNIFNTILSIILGAYYEKTFKNCVKQISIVDDTLEKLGITTNYEQLRMKTLLVIIGISITVLLFIFLRALFLYHTNEFKVVQAICVPFVLYYNYYISFLGSLRVTWMLRYIELKFDQLIIHLKQVAKVTEHEINLSKEHPLLILRHTRFLKPSCISEYTTWIIIHLYLELRKISRRVNLIFGIQMTLDIGLCFAFTSTISQELFKVNFLYELKRDDARMYMTMMLVYSCIYFLRVFFINYQCEKVITKVTSTRQLISTLSCSSRKVVVRENVLQFLLHIVQAPLKFYGCGLFEFGLKFFYKITISFATVIVIAAQVHANKMRF